MVGSRLVGVYAALSESHAEEEEEKKEGEKMTLFL